MEDSTISTLTAGHQNDDTSGRVLCVARSCGTLGLHLEYQHLWYMRTAEAFYLPGEFQWDHSNANKLENWEQVYNILMTTKLSENPFKASSQPTVLDKNEFNYTAVKYMLRLDYDVQNCALLKRAATYGGPDVLRLLLGDSRVDAGSRTITLPYAIEEASRRGRMDMIEVLLAHPEVKEHLSYPWGMRFLSSGLMGAAETDQLDIAQLLLGLRAYRLDYIDGVFDRAIKNNSLEVLRLLLSKLNPNLQHRMDYIRYTALEEDRVPALLLLLARSSDVPANIYNDWALDALKSNKLGVLRALIKGFSVCGSMEMKLLRPACEIADVSAIRLLLECEYITIAHVNEAIQAAVIRDNKGVLKALLERADQNDQLVWYARTDLLVGGLPSEFRWEYGKNSLENWKQVYNILEHAQSGYEEPFAFRSPYNPSVLEINGYNYLAVKYLLHLGYRTEGMASVRRAIRYSGRLDVIELLLHSRDISIRSDITAESPNALQDAAWMDRLDIVKAIVEVAVTRGELDDEAGLELLVDGMESAAEWNRALMLKYLFGIREHEVDSLLRVFEAAIREEATDALQALLNLVNPDQEHLLEYSRFAILSEKKRSLDVLTARIREL